MADLIQKELQYFFFCGKDDYLVDREARKLYEKQSVGLVDDFSREIIDGAAPNVGKIESIIKLFIQSAQTPSLFGENKVVWLRGINFLEDSVIGKSETTKTQIELLIEVLGSFNYNTVCIILSASPVDQRTRGFKALKSGCRSQCQLIGNDSDSQTLVKMALEECKVLGVTIHREALETLITKVAGDSRLLVQEIQKLANFIGRSPESIDIKLVTEMVAQAGEGDFFEFSEAFFSLDLNWALDALTRYFFTQKESRPLITSLFNKLRLIIQLRALLDAKSIEVPSYGGLDKNMLEKLAVEYKLPYANPDNKSAFNVFSQNAWYLSKLATIAKKIPLKKLIDFDFSLIHAFEQILDQSQPEEQEAVMRQLVIKCLK